jgi:putative ABC transport system permease protein
MGTTRKEINRIINVQMIVIFFLPFIIACSHASFALKTLSDIMQKNLVSVGLSVIFVYFVFQILYYFIIKWIYRAQIKMI